jgi:hypothetical protein
MKYGYSGRNYWGILLLQKVEGTNEGKCDTSLALCKTFQTPPVYGVILYVCVSIITPLEEISVMFLHERRLDEFTARF